jgi:hypothetical protein
MIKLIDKMKHWGVRAVKQILVVAFFVISTPAVLSTQTVDRPEETPKKVIEEYVKLIHDGALLTSEGWSEADKFWELPGAAPDNTVISIVSGASTISEYRVEGRTAEVHEWGVNDLGRIDPALRYLPPRSSDWVIKVYHLVLTDRHWQRGPDGKPGREVVGPLVWRIKGSQAVRWTTLDPAIHYVTEMRDKSKDSIVKSNADATIAILKGLAK